ncbi:NmrA family NAD(P)-binding protein [Dyella halodurans]|uniref:NmrA family NAD(P)-binding protein n=1 Tax=Dyella halodurans TaxID=1920171 RepID=A0ABV9C2V8_9GAMM|nr:NmrA family NAD(P)-binding protein [Dyella halodurans]
MFAIMGVTGQVGGHVARRLLDAGQQVRVVVRDAAKAQSWLDRGCETTEASIDDVERLTSALQGVDGAFLMIPPDYDPAPGFPRIHQIIDSVCAAVEATRPGKVVFLSSVGAHVQEFSLLNNARMIEQALRTLPVPTAFVRPAWFMENAAWDVVAARSGTAPSFLQPLDHPIPMVATADIGHTVADVLLEQWTGSRVVELEGPRRYSANDIATGFATVLGHPVRMEPVPRDTWEALFRAQGMQHPEPRMRMLDGFNEGWIDFEHTQGTMRKGTVTLDSVLRALVERSH